MFLQSTSPMLKACWTPLGWEEEGMKQEVDKLQLVSAFDWQWSDSVIDS